MEFSEIAAGMNAEIRRTVTDADVVLFAGVTGDMNPAHMDAVAAAGTRFGQRVAHGMLCAGYISAVLGMKLPGPGVIYMGQSLRFMRPVFIGDTVTARVEVLSVVTEKRRVQLATRCFNQNGEQVLDGEALVWVPEEAGDGANPVRKRAPVKKAGKAKQNEPVKKAGKAKRS
ncbi:MAG: MaoC family dehydratase [Gemmatimonadetes bacterium]|nr:MaoC family dehydratase [Gemmatimonadota bacterium]